MGQIGLAGASTSRGRQGPIVLDRLIVFSLAAHTIQAAVLFLDTTGWLGAAGYTGLARSIRRAIRRRRRYAQPPR